MRKLLKKSLACCLAIALCFTMVFGAVSASAAATALADIGEVTVTNDKDAVALPITITDTSAGGINIATLSIALPELNGVYLNEITNIEAEGVKVEWVTADGNGCAAGEPNFVAPMITGNKFTLMLEANGDLSGFKNATINVSFAVKGANLGVYVVSATKFTAAGSTSEEDIYDIETATEAGSITVEDPHVCEGKGDYLYDEGYHWQLCDCGKQDKLNYAEHDFNDGVVTVEADCDTTGEKTYTCEVCGKTKTETIPATGHDYEAVVTAPTCTAEGYTTYTCSVCDDSYVADKVAAKGHTWDDGVINPAPTCTTEGVKTFTCSACNETRTEAVSELGHTEVAYEDVAATCTQTGYTGGTYCSVCGATIVERTVVDALGHTEAAAVKEKEVEPTLNSSGSYDSVVYCSVCGAELSRTKVIVDALTGAVAEIGGFKYATLAEAIAAAKAGEEIDLLEDITLEKGIILNGVTLDGNGYTLTVTGEGGVAADGETYAIFSAEGLTVKNIKIVGGARGIYVNPAYAGLKYDVVFENVTILASCRAFNVTDYSKKDPVKLIVTGGEFAGKISWSSRMNATFTGVKFSENASVKGNVIDLRGNVTFDTCIFADGYKLSAEDLKGGEFIKVENTIVDAPADYKWVDGVLVAKDYVAQIGDAKFESLEEAIAAAKAGDEIDLLEDITLEKGIILNGVTLDGNGYTLTVTGEGGVAADGETYAIFSAEGLTVKNIKIVGGARGIYVNPAYAGLKYDVVFENVTILASCRAFNVTDYSKKDPVKLIVTGGEFAGKISWSSRMNATFTGVKFSENASVKGNVIDLRGNVTFDTCIFADGYKLSAEDLKGGEFIKVENTIVDAPADYKWVDGVLVAKDYVAQIGDAKFESLEEAIAAAKAGDEIDLLEDITLEKGIILNGVTLDGNGYTLTVTGEGGVAADGETYAIFSAEGLTVKNIKIVGGARGIYVNPAYAGLKYDVVFENVTILASCRAFNVTDYSKKDPVKLIVTGGEFAGKISWSSRMNATFTGVKFSENASVKGNVIDLRGNVTFDTCIFADGYKLSAEDLKGGEFIKVENTIVDAPADYKWVDGVLVAKDYVAQIGDAKFESLEEAIAAAKAGDEIDLLADITLEKGIILNGVTLDGNGYTLTVTGEGGVAADGETYAIFSAEGLTVKNIKIVGGARGIYVNPAYAGLKYDVVFENVTILASCRAFNVTDYSKKDPVKLIVTGGEFAGKISWSSRMNATFTGVKFSENASVKGNVIDLRGDVTFDTCIFADGYKLSAEDLKGGEIIKVENTIVDAPADYKWVDGVLVAKDYVAKIGEAKFESLEEALAAAKAGEEIDLLADITVEHSTLDLPAGVILDGNNNTITVIGEVTKSGGEYAIRANGGGTIKNITISGGSRGVWVDNGGYTSVDITLDNVTIIDSARAISVNGYKDVTSGTGKLTVTNSKLAGWISWNGGVIGSASFTNCEFVAQENPVRGNGLDLYTNTTLTDCAFEEGFVLCVDDLPDSAIIAKEGTTEIDAPEGYVWYNNVLHAHTYDAVVTAPTCTEGGYTTYTCSVCGDTYDDDHTDALGHKYDAVVTAPTCTEGGYTTYTCSVCGDTYVADETAALGHDYSAVVTAPTCTEGGFTTYTCSVCGDTYVADETAALDHNVVFTDNGNGTHDGTCDRVGCGIVVTDNEAHIDANADNVCDKCSATIAVACEHKNTTFVSATPAVEDGSTGNIKLVCADCGKEVDKTVTYLRNSQLAGSNGTLSLGQITEFKLRLNNNNYGSLNAKDAYVVYTQIDVNGNVYKTEAINISEFVLEGSYYVNFVPVDFDRMCDVFKINVYRQESTGEWVSGLEREYSVKNSAMAIVKGTNTQAEKVAAANLLKAGAESQRYVNKTVAAEKCADYELTGEYAEFVTTTVPSVVVDDTNWIKTTGHAENKEGYFATPGAILGAKVQISVKADIRYYEEEITDLKIVCSYISYDGAKITETITAEDYTLNGNRAEFGYGLMAPDMRAPVSFQIFNGDTPISQVNVFSVEAILAKFLASNPSESAVVYALLNYSDAAAEL